MSDLTLRLGPQIVLSPLRELVREKVIPSEAYDLENKRFEIEIYQELHDLGILQLITPKIYGGQEASVTDLAWVYREIGYGSVSTAATALGNLLGYSSVVLYGNDDLRSRLCGQYLKEFSLWSFGMSEADVGSDLTQTKTVAREVPGGYILNGEKNFITNASLAKHICVFARLIDGKGNDRGVTCFYLAGDNPGLARGATYDKMAMRKANTGTLIFKDAFIPQEHLLGGPGNGLKVLGHCLNRSKTMMAAMGVGVCHRALDLVYERLAGTTRFNKTLIEQPVIRHLLVQMNTQVEAAWLMVCNACVAWEKDDLATTRASMAKLFCGATAVEVTNQAVELFGSRGLFNDHEVSRLYRDAKSLEIIEGPSFVQELLIAREILPRGAGNRRGEEIDHGAKTNNVIELGRSRKSA